MSYAHTVAPDPTLAADVLTHTAGVVGRMGDRRANIVWSDDPTGASVTESFTITLPRLGTDFTRREWKCRQGFLDHELAHVRDTAFKAFHDINKQHGAIAAQALLVGSYRNKRAA